MYTERGEDIFAAISSDDVVLPRQARYQPLCESGQTPRTASTSLLRLGNYELCAQRRSVYLLYTVRIFLASRTIISCYSYSGIRQGSINSQIVSTFNKKWSQHYHTIYKQKFNTEGSLIAFVINFLTVSSLHSRHKQADTYKTNGIFNRCLYTDVHLLWLCL